MASAVVIIQKNRLRDKKIREIKKGHDKLSKGSNMGKKELGNRDNPEGPRGRGAAPGVARGSGEGTAE